MDNPNLFPGVFEPALLEFGSNKGHKDEGEEDEKPKARSPLGEEVVENQSPFFRPPPQSTQMS